MKTSMVPKGISDADLRAEQALKAERDFKYNTNQALLALNEKISSLQQEHQRVISKADNDKKQIQIEFENVRERIINSLMSLNQRVGDVETKLLDCVGKFNAFQDKCKEEFLFKEEFIQGLEFIELHINSYDVRHSLKIDNILHNFENLKGQSQQEIERVRQELTPVPLECDPVQEKIDYSLKTFRVDFEGLVKEIALLKKSSFYDQKKFENIYTLIERLKAGKE